jgi:gephyrin
LYPIAFDSFPGTQTLPVLEKGYACKVSTGAPIPKGADAVIMVEETSLEEGLARLPKPTNTHIREQGSDLALGEHVMTRKRLQPADIGLLFSMGIESIPILKKPVIAVLSTGNELVNAPTSLAPFQIYDANRPALLATIESLGFPSVDCGICKDDPQLLREKVEFALSKADIVITTGSVSMGECDYLKSILETLGTLHFGRVKIKPGKPFTFASKENKLMFALPGNPASALVTFHLFVVPALEKMTGISLTKTKTVTLATELEADPERDEFVRVTVDKEDRVMPTGSQRSSRLASMTGTLVGLVRVVKNLPKNAVVPCILLHSQ